MTAGCRNLVVGIGSAHGDDQAGWRLIDTLTAREITSARLRKAAVPHDMIDWMNDCQSLHIVDACESEQDLQRRELSTDRVTVITKTRSGSSHQLGIGNVVDLADSLGMLPPRVVLWAIPGAEFRANAEITDACSKHVQLCADLLQRDLVGDRSSTCTKDQGTVG